MNGAFVTPLARVAPHCELYAAVTARVAAVQVAVQSAAIATAVAGTLGALCSVSSVASSSESHQLAAAPSRGIVCFDVTEISLAAAMTQTKRDQALTKVDESERNR